MAWLVWECTHAFECDVLHDFVYEWMIMCFFHLGSFVEAQLGCHAHRMNNCKDVVHTTLEMEDTIYVWWKKVVYLSCWDLPHHGTSCHTLSTIGKPLISMGALTWFHKFLAYGGEVIEYWTKSSLKIHLNQNQNLWVNLVPLLAVFGKPSSTS
jgi:hypothetical protein